MPSLAADGRKLASLVGMMEEVQEMKKSHWKETQTIERLQKIVRKSTRLVENTNSSSVVAVDAKILYAGSELVSSNVTSFETNLTAFNLEEYKNGILSYLESHSDGAPTEMSWKCFAPVTYHLYRKSDPPVFMLGSLSFAPEPVKEKTKVERMKRVAGSKTTLLADVEPSQASNDEIEDSVYEHILKSLVRCYKSNGKKPVNFIEFILNPDSYWNSVQNIFHFSFLVRDGRVKTFIDDDGLPVVEPVLGKSRRSEKQTQNKESEKDKDKDKNNENEADAPKSNQFIFTLSMKQWSDCIEKFNITSPKIKPIHQK